MTEIVPFTQETLTPILTLADLGVLTATSLEFTEEVSYEQYETMGTALGAFDRACRWWVGDWLLYGERTYEADRYAQAADLTGLSIETIKNRVWLSQAIAPNRRRALVSYSCHVVVAPLTANAQKRWLRYAEENACTVADLKAAIKAAAVSTGEQQSVETHDVVEPDLNLLLQAAGSLVRNAQDAGENVIVRKDDFVRVRAALGMEG